MEDLQGAAVRVTPERERADEWAVVLAATGIPHRLRRRPDGWALIVAPLDAHAALDALDGYDRERQDERADTGAAVATPVGGAKTVGGPRSVPRPARPPRHEPGRRHPCPSLRTPGRRRARFGRWTRAAESAAPVGAMDAGVGRARGAGRLLALRFLVTLHLSLGARRIHEDLPCRTALHRG